MHLKVRAELIFDFATGSETFVSVQATYSRDQTVLSERLLLSPATEMVQDEPDVYGERRFRARFEGEAGIVYEALVDNGRRITLAPLARKSDWLSLPQDALEYLTPSRYCPSDRFLPFANREFGAIADGGAQVLSVRDWIHHNVDYTPGVSNIETTAERTFVDRAGVCCDFSHLGIALCRALNIPARAPAPMPDSLTHRTSMQCSRFSSMAAGGWSIRHGLRRSRVWCASALGATRGTSHSSRPQALAWVCRRA